MKDVKQAVSTHVGPHVKAAIHSAGLHLTSAVEFARAQVGDVLHPLFEVETCVSSLVSLRLEWSDKLVEWFPPDKPTPILSCKICSLDCSARYAAYLKFTFPWLGRTWHQTIHGAVQPRVSRRSSTMW